jgi:hypothetical protein
MKNEHCACSQNGSLSFWRQKIVFEKLMNACSSVPFLMVLLVIVVGGFVAAATFIQP